MTDTLTAAEKLGRELDAKVGHDDLARMETKMENRMDRMETKMDAIMQAIQNMAGRMDEMSKQLAAKR